MELTWALATTVDQPYALDAHCRFLEETVRQPSYVLYEQDGAMPGAKPAVPPAICVSQVKSVKVYVQGKPTFFRITNTLNTTYLRRYTYTYTAEVHDHIVSGWPADPAFVDVCAAPLNMHFTDVNNLYTLSNLGSSGIAVTTTASWFGELVHKFVYLQLVKACKIRATGDRYTQAIKESRKQIFNIAIVNRLVRVIVRMLDAPAWTVMDVGQPSVYTIPGLVIKRKDYTSTVWCPRCIPDQIMRKGKEWQVCEYKTRYGGKADTDSSNASNAQEMVVQCIWQAMAFKLCTDRKVVSAKAIEVAMRSNRITHSATRVLVWDCKPHELAPWFAWTLIGMLEHKKVPSKKKGLKYTC